MRCPHAADVEPLPAPVMKQLELIVTLTRDGKASSSYVRSLTGFAKGWQPRLPKIDV
jgi:hypothetical protein